MAVTLALVAIMRWPAAGAVPTVTLHQRAPGSLLNYAGVPSALDATADPSLDAAIIAGYDFAFFETNTIGPGDYAGTL